MTVRDVSDCRAAGGLGGELPAVAERSPRSIGRRTAAVLLVVALLIIPTWGMKLYQLRASVSDYAQWWEQPRGEPGGVVYVALGDSVAQGIGASRPERGYVGLIAERLREVTGRPVQVVNFSRSGARVRDVVEEQLPLLAALHPDLVTVGVGGNDIREYDADQFERDVAGLVAGLPAGTVIADAPYFMHGATQRDAGQAAATVSRLAGQRGLLVAPLQEALRDQGWQAMVTDFAADWFHPNDNGHLAWASAFWQVIGPRPDTRSYSSSSNEHAGDSAEGRLETAEPTGRQVRRWVLNGPPTSKAEEGWVTQGSQLRCELTHFRDGALPLLRTPVVPSPG